MYEIIKEIQVKRSYAAVVKKVQTKGKSKKAKPDGKAPEDTRDKSYAIIAKALEKRAATSKVLLDSERQKEMDLAKEYSRRKMQEHRLQRAAESARLQLKVAAIAALPEGKLQEAAKVPDYTPFPAARIAATLTPPLPGFLEDQQRGAERKATIKKIR